MSAAPHHDWNRPLSWWLLFLAFLFAASDRFELGFFGFLGLAITSAFVFAILDAIWDEAVEGFHRGGREKRRAIDEERVRRLREDAEAEIDYEKEES